MYILLLFFLLNNRSVKNERERDGEMAELTNDNGLTCWSSKETSLHV